LDLFNYKVIENNVKNYKIINTCVKHLDHRQRLSALHHAVKYNHAMAVRRLLAHISLDDDDSKDAIASAQDAAILFGHKNIANVINESERKQFQTQEAM